MIIEYLDKYQQEPEYYQFLQTLFFHLHDDFLPMLQEAESKGLKLCPIDDMVDEIVLENVIMR